MFEVVFVDRGLHDRVDRAALLAETTEDALEQVDVVTGGAALTVALARRRVDGERHCRATPLAQLAGDATFLAIRITAQRMQAAEAVRIRALLHRITQRDLRPEHV